MKYTLDLGHTITLDNDAITIDAGYTLDNAWAPTLDSTSVTLDQEYFPVTVSGSGYFDGLYWSHPYWESSYWSNAQPGALVPGKDGRIGYWAAPYWNHHYFGDPYWGGAQVTITDVEFVPYGRSEKRKRTRRGKGFKNVPKTYAKPYTTKPYYVERTFGQWVDLDKRDEERRLAALQITLHAQARARQAALQAEDDAWVILTAIALDEDESCELPDIPAEHREAVSLLVALAQL